ncbi:DMT family transporter [Vibrio tritonius]|uniref:DMT family transporter n=1 Tax=Vibrio tritonius TaxID=1435069 RepID=UPI000838060C|nr:DMT family transporter [Vibrio tritonius]
MNLFYFVIALAGGAGLSIQAAVNSRLSVTVGSQPLIAACISFGIGALCLGVASLAFANWQGTAVNLVHQASWKWLGGVIGAAFVFTSIFLAPKIGITNVMFLFIIGQLATGLCIDTWGWLEMPTRPVHWWHFTGLAIMLSGLVFFVYGERLFGKM